MEKEEMEYYEKVGAMIAGAAATMEKDALNFKSIWEGTKGLPGKALSGIKAAPKALGRLYLAPGKGVGAALKAEKKSYKDIAKAFAKAGLVYGGTGAGAGGAAYLLKKKKGSKK